MMGRRLAAILRVEVWVEDHPGLDSRALASAFGESELAASMYCDELLDGAAWSAHLDSVFSVSALLEPEPADFLREVIGSGTDSTISSTDMGGHDGS